MLDKLIYVLLTSHEANLVWSSLSGVCCVDKSACLHKLSAEY